ncbi:hypothetical protein DRQ15_04080 [candidate division KSB1 bacterium]|nr:MAG: hypothetical protein DRQ15_04080 [candidate division KSB1 bacterium]
MWLSTRGKILALITTTVITLVLLTAFLQAQKVSFGIIFLIVVLVLSLSYLQLYKLFRPLNQILENLAPLDGIRALPYDQYQPMSIKSGDEFGHLAEVFNRVLLDMKKLVEREKEAVRDLLEVVDAIVHGDLSKRAPVQSKDELGKLAEAINKMTADLQRAQDEIKEYQRDLEKKVEERTRELQNVNMRLRREMAEKEDFLRAVSHDLGAPLRNILGIANMIERKFGNELTDEVRDRLRRISKNAQQELELIAELLELSRIKTRRQQFEPVDIKQLLQQIQDNFSYALEEHNIQLVLQNNYPVIIAEKNRIKQVFQNLIDNAIKYIGERADPRIEIGYANFNGMHKFWVKDNGRGIRKEDQQTIFHVFRRVKDPKIATIPGKGVGLTTVKSIIETYNGEIWVESELGQGSTFYFTLDKMTVQDAA